MAPFILSAAIALSCGTYSVKCKCGPSTPFEGFQIYVVEKCDREENWYTEYGQQQFTTEEECKNAIPSDLTCKELPKQ